MSRILKFTLLFMLSVLCFTFVISADADYLVLDASELAESMSVKDSEFLSESIYADGKAYVEFTSPVTGTAADGTQIEFNFAYTKATEGYLVKDYPFVKIGYKSDIANSGATLDINYGLDYQGKETRIWGYAPNYDKSGKDSALIFDIREVFSGGESITDYAYENIDADSVCNYLRLKPYNRQERAEDEKFAVEYIGFFKTKEAAESYMHKIEDKITELKPSFGYYKLAVGESFELGVTCLPTYASVSGVKYASSDTAVATVDAQGRVTAHGAGKADITVSADGTDAVAQTHVIVEENKPLDIYAKDHEGGEEVVVNVLGDSISADSAPNEQSSKYHGIWAGSFKMSVNNWSRGGSAMTGNITNENNRLETYVPRMERMIANDITSYDTVTSDKSPDLIDVYGGTNDYNGNWKIGEPTDRTRNTYYGALSELIEKAYANYPDAKLVFFTPIKRADYSDKPGYDNTGTRSYELDACVDAMKEICEIYNVPCFDVYNNEQTNLIGLRSVYITDGVHMSPAGHRIFAAVAIEEMEKAGVIKTHGYTAPEAVTRELSASRSTSADYYIYAAAQLNGRTRYDNSTALDRQRLTKHEYVDGVMRFKAETLTSSLAPSISVNLSSFSFAPTDYPYMTVVYKTSSEAEKINVKLRGNNNRVSVLAEDKLPDLVSGETASFTVNILDYENDDIKFASDRIYTDLYYTIEFFNSTKKMNVQSYVDIVAVGFFKDEAVAKSYDGVNVKGSGFTDTLTHWACDNIDYVVREGLFNGVTKTEFAPNKKMTRAMLATVLARLAGDADKSAKSTYTDVAADAWYASAAAWAEENNIVDAGGAFRPDDNATREEMADMLYRYAKAYGKDVSSKAELTFTDSDNVTYTDGVAYCVGAGIIAGYDDNTVRPAGEATRAEVATMLKRFVMA